MSNQKPRTPYLQLRAGLVLVVALSACIISTLGVGSPSSEARTSTQEGAELPARQQKLLSNNIPRHLPIKVNVKNLNSRKWVDDLEIEVTNTSGKPIYFLLFYVALPEVTSPSGITIVFPMRYGRMDFVDFTKPLRPDDVPIQPGDTYVFKSGHTTEDWEKFKAATNNPEPRLVQLVFSNLYFGDGTGYADTSGRPVDARARRGE